ncbi:MAG: hypothetical protein JO316_01110 [Abitibacteriaceae bacterium]|nr:hypothetical protein [Abditibacteriaceae bacterium]MBV9863928.1 hypothetical protein [Abditibacteriaceae bacterium]
MQKHVVITVRILAHLALVSILLTNAMQVQAKPARFHPRQAHTQTKRLTVLDYFYLLPSLGIGYKATQHEKRELLQSQNHPIVDVRHDYLLFHPDSSPAEQLAVFRTHGKTDLLADSLPDSDSDYNSFGLYRLQNGKLRDVTRQMLPLPAHTERFLYELPRLGTTIHVYSFNLDKQSRHHAFDLQWRGGRFIKVRGAPPEQKHSN